MKNTKRFHAPGIYHKLTVKMVTGKWLARLLKDTNVLAAYVHEDGEIFVSKELATQPKVHCFFHEVAHHIVETLEGMEDETKCDVLGAYLMRLGENYEQIKKNLKTEE